jgi:hypothetical protein
VPLRFESGGNRILQEAKGVSAKKSIRSVPATRPPGGACRIWDVVAFPRAAKGGKYVPLKQ